MRDLDARWRLLHREIVRLIALIALVVVGFVLTRDVARAVSSSRHRDSAAWYARAVAADSSPAGLQRRLTSLRRAVANDRGNRQYRIALAAALESARDREAAVRVLTELRDAAPEDPQVNLQLARLEARRGNVDASRRYYQSVLSSLWMPARAEERRNVRFELIELLLAHDEQTRALPELLAVTAGLPADPNLQVRAGRLLLAAGDAARAREQFAHALAEQPGRDDALAGAGMAAFTLGDYPAARRYLSATALGPQAQDALAVTRAVLTLDPLEPRIGGAARRARLATVLAHVDSRLRACVSRLTPPPAALDARQTELAAFLKRLPRATGDARDFSEDGLTLAVGIESTIDTTCGAATTAEDRAIPLIGRRRGVTS